MKNIAKIQTNVRQLDEMDIKLLMYYYNYEGNITKSYYHIKQKFPLLSRQDYEYKFNYFLNTKVLLLQGYYLMYPVIPYYKFNIDNLNINLSNINYKQENVAECSFQIYS